MLVDLAADHQPRSSPIDERRAQLYELEHNGMLLPSCSSYCYERISPCRLASLPPTASYFAVLHPTAAFDTTGQARTVCSNGPMCAYFLLMCIEISHK